MKGVGFFFNTDYLQRILNRTVINTQNTSGSMSHFFMAGSWYFFMLLYHNFFLVYEIEACRISCNSFQAFSPNFFTLIHSSCRSSRQSQAGAGRRGQKSQREKEKKKKEKKSLKKTELAKLYFKVGWHIRGTSSYSCAFFLRDIYARTAASKKSILFKDERSETKHSPPCSEA